MRRIMILVLVAGIAFGARAEHAAHELIGQLGSRAALLILYRTQLADGSWRVNGEYLLVDTLHRRFVLGVGSPQLGVTTLNEGMTPILFGRAPTGTLQGVWHDGVYKGTRLGPGGQERERFEFKETFPSMADYSARVQCRAAEGGYEAALSLVVEKGRLRPGSLSWTSRDAASGQVCVLGAAQLRPRDDASGLRFELGAAGSGCVLRLTDLREAVRVSAEGCRAACGEKVGLEPLLLDSASSCRLLRPVTR